MQWAERIGRRLRLRDLHILLAVAKSGSMGRAASELAMSQPSVSKAIADLEHAVGLRLLDRSPQGIEPTIYGRALLKCGVAVFDDLRQGVKELEFLVDPTAGELRIGCTEPLAAGFVATVIDQLSRQYPRLDFVVIPADRVTLRNRELRERNVEVVVAPTLGLDPEADMDVETLFDDRQVVLAGPRSKWVNRRNIALADLLDEPWVLPPRDSVVGAYLAEAFRAGGLEPPRAHVVSFSIPLHLHLIATGRFVTMLPISMLHLGRQLPLRELAVAAPAFPRPIGIMTLRNRMLTPVAKLFIQHAREIAQLMARQPAPPRSAHAPGNTAQRGAALISRAPRLKVK
jgi:DNA-binding transcriptional LysR family regulator